MMLNGQNPDSLNALRESNVKALEALQINYGQAMGLGEKRPGQGSRMDDTYRQALQQRQGGNAGQTADDIASAAQSNEALFWAGLKKGLGLKPGEEIGQEGTGGGRPGDFNAPVLKPVKYAKRNCRKNCVNLRCQIE